MERCVKCGWEGEENRFYSTVPLQPGRAEPKFCSSCWQGRGGELRPKEFSTTRTKSPK